MTKRFLVRCKHKRVKYELEDELIEVRQDRLDETWFWSHRIFGCSKGYATPEDAVYGMLQDHACYAIQITDYETEDEFAVYLGDMKALAAARQKKT